MIERSWPTLVIVAACVGMALANAVRAPGAAVVAVAAGAAGAVLARPSARLPLWILAVLLAGWWWGSVRLDAFDRSLLEPQIDRSAAAEVVVTGPARHTEFAIRVPAEVRRFGELAVRERVLLELPVGRSPPQGAILVLRAKAVAPRGPENGDDDFDERGWLARRGVHVILRGGEWSIVGRRGGVGGLSDRLREHLSRAIGAGLTGERRAVLAGIVLGEDEGLSEELRDSFKTSGLFHLLAVSGQNVAFLAGAVLGLAWLLAIPRLAAQIAVLAAIAGYVLAVGWQPSVVRAGVAGALVSLAWLLSRPNDRWHFMALGAAVLLAWTPASLLEPGFQLSFAAVASIFLLVPRLDRALEGYPVPRGLRLVLAVSVACGAATAPILWLQFGQVPLYSLLANVLASAAVGPLLSVALVGALVEPMVPSATLALAWINGWIAAYIAACARLVAQLPHARIGSGAAVAVLLAAPVAIVLLRRLPPWRRPLATACAATLVPALLVWQFWPVRPLPPPAGLRITFLDVGQGDAILLQVPQGAILVDQGPPEGRVAQQLSALGVRRLSAVVLTHPQRDHIGGAEEVLRKLAVESVLDPQLTGSSPYREDALVAASAHRVPVVPARAGASWQLGSLRLQVLWPNRPGLAGEDPNRLPVVLLATYGEIDALLTADAETEVTARLLSRPVEILKVAHHGSEDDGLEEELRQLRPTIAVISCGRGNDYGHPRAETLAALRTVSGLNLYRTDLDGRVVVDSDGHRISVRTQH
ncbi:MAG: DNA internalization-related competence protein ComEC/Rec2 [Actinobacteria bacterium]|nr:DNA internalization-related competence protein ComEC/Rec2 [Actinomycetota bacterium]